MLRKASLKVVQDPCSLDHVVPDDPDDVCGVGGIVRVADTERWHT